MVTYFAKFPVISYPAAGVANTVVFCRDLLQRARVRQFLTNNALVFYPYTVPDGTSPEMIAHKLYGSTDLFWVVLLPNMILDPYYEWPMSYDNLMASIRKRYSAQGQDGLVYAQQTVHHYEDVYGNMIDETTYGLLPVAQRKIVYLFDYEVAENEAKREIKLLDKRYAQQIDLEMTKILASPIA